MTELIVSRGDTFPRSYLDTYRANRSSELYNELSSSKSDELVLQTPSDIPVAKELQHGHSENLLDSNTGSSTGYNDLEYMQTSPIVLPKILRKVPLYDKVDPEDSIRDIITENDFYRFVLFKKHYDKYLHLSKKYEEARNIAYYLEEKYHEVKMERDDLIHQREELTKKLETNELILKEKEDEVFLQFERVVYLEDQCEKIKAEKDKCQQVKDIFEKERDKALRLLQEQSKESECNRRKLERARQEVVHHMTKIKNEKDDLERENSVLKETLECERKVIFQNISQQQGCRLHGQMELKSKGGNRQSDSLTSQFQKALQHLATCKQKKCSVCAYTKATYRKLSPHHRKYDKKLFGCLQTPFLEMRNMIRPPPSPIRGGEGESLSEWFCHVDERCACASEAASARSDCCSSISVPLAELSISYMDEGSETSSNRYYCAEARDNEAEYSSQANYNSFRGCGSDSGFSSDICPDYKSTATTPREKFCPKASLDETDCDKLTRTKWTASFRKFVNRIIK
ncbi:unnamed protein product [Brassicogethes aeneus]|uniref:Uncharacterized protein n=1 Tax=Brassicogethes aeneus TaxID=1431903 RepID=A0A9P0AR67_BRAAE|nr:unnamed protein product [Brassicogethes aeneus]